jgi:hypothetical protein
MLQEYKSSVDKIRAMLAISMFETSLQRLDGLTTVISAGAPLCYQHGANTLRLSVGEYTTTLVFNLEQGDFILEFGTVENNFQIQTRPDADEVIDWGLLLQLWFDALAGYLNEV